jgi:predicted metal-dependent hydrolase
MDGLFDEVYDELLEKILNNPKVQGYMKETKEQFPEATQYEIESDALDNFFSASYEEIFSIEEIFNGIVEGVKDEIDYITSSKKMLADNIDFKLEDYVTDELEYIRNKLEEALKRKHGKAKQTT